MGETLQWTCKETEQDRMRMNITKEVWSKGREGMLKLIEYPKTNSTLQRNLKGH
jgi:hypothetical protein